MPQALPAPWNLSSGGSRGMWLSWLVLVWNLIRGYSIGDQIKYSEYDQTWQDPPVPSSDQRCITMRSSLANFFVIDFPPTFGENLVREVALTTLLFASFKSGLSVSGF